MDGSKQPRDNSNGIASSSGEWTREEALQFSSEGGQLCVTSPVARFESSEQAVSDQSVSEWEDDTAPTSQPPDWMSSPAAMLGEHSLCEDGRGAYPARVPLVCVQEHPSEDYNYEEAVTSFGAAPATTLNGTKGESSPPRLITFLNDSNSTSPNKETDQPNSDNHKHVLNLNSDTSDLAEEGHDLVPQMTPKRSRPGVVLLGRGNSFSLGRSEVILLHGRGEPGTPRRPQAARAPAPPPISTPDDPVDPQGEELERLWCRAEATMAARSGRVHAVLHEFGIGQDSGGEEEELVWRAVQDQGVS